MRGWLHHPEMNTKFKDTGMVGKSGEESSFCSYYVLNIFRMFFLSLVSALFLAVYVN